MGLPTEVTKAGTKKAFRYTEAQIFGGVFLGDIEQIAFSKEPYKYIQEQLERLGIKWIIYQEKNLKK